MTTIIVAIISGLSVAIPSIITSLVTSKNNKDMILYRITQLENKVEKHNTIVERMALAEKDLKAIWRNIDEIKGARRWK